MIGMNVRVLRLVSSFLTAEELKPIIHRLYPGELFYATHYTKYLMNEVRVYLL